MIAADFSPSNRLSLATEIIAAPSPALIDRINAILDRPNRTYFGEKARCACAGCERTRARKLMCASCGYRGEPLVEPCECREARASNIRFCLGRMAVIEGGEVVKPGDYGLERLRSMLAEATASPDAMCPSRTSEKMRDKTPYCAHGMGACPTCGAPAHASSGKIGVDGEDAIATIRDLRAALAAATEPTRTTRGLFKTRLAGLWRRVAPSAPRQGVSVVLEQVIKTPQHIDLLVGGDDFSDTYEMTDGRVGLRVKNMRAIRALGETLIELANHLDSSKIGAAVE